MNWNGEKLNALLNERGISKSELAERLGVSRPTVYKWLAGQEPRGSLLLQLCVLLDVDPPKLYDGKPAVSSGSSGAGGKLFKRSGIKLIYVLLTDPMLDTDPRENRLNSSVRALARDSGLSTGSVSELFAEMKERGFLLTEGRMRILINRKVLMDQWMHGYMDYRIKVQCQCFEGDSVSWWRDRLPEKNGFLWGGEPAASVLTHGYLRPQKLTLYTSQPLYDLVVDANLHQVPVGGNVEFVAPLVRSEDGEQGCVHPLLVYADLICSSDDRNTETATRIHDQYLRNIIESA